MGNLHKVWLEVPKDVSIDELKEAFRNYFGKEWEEVLSFSERPFSYHATNNAYFSVCDLQPVENLTLEQLLKTKGINRPNIIVS